MKLVSVALCFLMASCVSYTLVSPGSKTFGGLEVSTSQTWNRVPAQLSPASRKDARVWTQDGVLLDRLMIIPAVPEGETIFRSQSKSQALPAFRSDMNPKEIEELTESSITKLFGEGQVIAETSKLRPHRFGDHQGFLFNLHLAVNDGPDYGGIVGAFVVAGKLNLVVFLGAKPYYFDKHKDEALAVIRGASA
jgi:hypothetical protein